MRLNQRIAIFALLSLFVTGAYALTINDPHETSYTGLVPVNVTANETQDSMSFSVANISSSCDNCSSITDELNLSPGNYTLTATSTLGNNTENGSVDFIVVLPVNETNQSNRTGNETEPLEITIIKPIEGNYYEDIELEFETNKPANITYELNGENFSACENCTEYETGFGLDPGLYVLTAYAAAGNETANDTVTFTMLEEDNQTLKVVIVRPRSKRYYDEDVELKILTNMEADISYELNNDTFPGCDDCNELEESLTLEPGTYTLIAYAEAGNMTANDSVVFKVLGEEERGKAHRWKFKDLPYMLRHGEITDEELADIIGTGEVPMGYIKKLIETRRLGRRSIDAMLHLPHQPRGIFKRLVGWMGKHELSYKELIFENYELNDEQVAIIITDKDTSEETIEKIKKMLDNRESKLGKPVRYYKGTQWDDTPFQHDYYDEDYWDQLEQLQQEQAQEMEQLQEELKDDYKDWFEEHQEDLAELWQIQQDLEKKYQEHLEKKAQLAEEQAQEQQELHEEQWRDVSDDEDLEDWQWWKEEQDSDQGSEDDEDAGTLANWRRRQQELNQELAQYHKEKQQEHEQEKTYKKWEAGRQTGTRGRSSQNDHGWNDWNGH